MADHELFINFCKELEKISQTTKRLEIQSILTQYYKKIHEQTPESFIPILMLSNATVYPEYLNRELGIGENAIIGVVAEATGKSINNVKTKYSETGDLGAIAMKYRVSQLFISKAQLSVNDVYNGLRSIANECGSKSVNSKKMIMLGLMGKSSPLESKYMIRLFEGQLKIGLALKTVLISLANTFSEDSVDQIKSAYNRQPDLERLVDAILKYGADGLDKHFKVTPGIPLKPMLANPSKDVTTALKKVENKKFTCEYKYDGERIQIHRYNNGNIKTFSRNLENSTDKFPDVTKIFQDYDKDFIIDAEVVAYDQKEQKILPFQVLSTRKRKDVEINKIEVDVCIFAFDLISFDGISYLDKPFETRRSVLRSEFKEIENKFYFSEYVDCSTAEEVEVFFNKSAELNFEGIMLKTLGEDSTYMPSQRSNKWVKLKKDYLDTFPDSLDLVVMGAYYGKGKRTGFYGGFLLGVYNDENNTYETICKLGTGFDDANLSTFYEKLTEHIIEAPKNYVYREGIKPNIWFEPKFVWEVRSAGVSSSPVHTASLDTTGKGISLRFPRFIRERCDKDPINASTSYQVYQMYLDTTAEDEE